MPKIVDNGKANDTFSVEAPRTYFTGYAFDKNIQYALINSDGSLSAWRPDSVVTLRRPRVCWKI